MITDQQNINKNNFDPSCLPENIEVHFIQREKIKSTLYKGITGKFLHLMAMRNARTSPQMRKHIQKQLFTTTLKLNIQLSAESELYLFNDRNKISRLFRLAFSEYSMIEEGIGNYIGLKLKKTEKILDFIFRVKRQKRHFGDNSRCKTIFLLNPNKGPKALQHKIKSIDFVDDKVISQYGYKFFKYNSQHNCAFIIATQPHVIEEFDLTVYLKLALALSQKGIPFAIKVHPREDIKYYQKAFPGIELIESKIPLELIIFGAKDKCRILSICTSAGTGFEKYCTRLNLIKDDELNSLYDIFDGLVKDNTLIDKRIENLFLEDPILRAQS